jgi:hypothetical protein
MQVPIPECLHGALAVEMARRIVESDWLYWTLQELPTSELQEPSIDFVLAAQKSLGMKRTHAQRKACASCGSEEGVLVKCGKCLVTYYCDATCQRAHWQEHKVSCQPPVPRAQNHYAIVLPDYNASRQYLAACGGESLMPLLIVSRENFEEVFGRQAFLKTFVELAHTGRPHPYLLNVTFNGARGYGVVSGLYSSPAPSTDAEQCDLSASSTVSRS